MTIVIANYVCKFVMRSCLKCPTMNLQNSTGVYMLIPSIVKIAGVNYKIEFAPLKTENECSGRAILGRAIIQIDDSMCADLKNATLIHEILEVIKEENQLKMSHRALQTMATQIYQVIVDNHEVFQK